MIDLAQQRFEPGVAGAQLVFGRGLVALERGAFEHLAERTGEQIEEIGADRLHDIIRRARFQRSDRDPPFLRAGDVHHRGHARQDAQPLERLEPVHSRHVMVDCDQIEGPAFFERGLRQRDALGAAFGDRQRITVARERPHGEAAQAGIVVDIEDRGASGLSHHPSGSISGTWITDRNRPSWRIAVAKLS